MQRFVMLTLAAAALALSFNTVRAAPESGGLDTLKLLFAKPGIAVEKAQYQSRDRGRREEGRGDRGRGGKGRGYWRRPYSSDDVRRLCMRQCTRTHPWYYCRWHCWPRYPHVGRNFFDRTKLI